MIKNNKNHNQPHVLHWIIGLAFFAASNMFVSQNGRDFFVSVFPTKQSPPYDGLVMPVQKVPNWTAMDIAQWKLPYDQIPQEKLIAVPRYDANQLKTPVEQLSWNNAEDLITRNAKITYATPYMGNYKLDGLEHVGSHLAVDIKVPSNTPVFSIGSGVVVKVSLMNSGFGNHIVVRHDNFPSFDNAAISTTYYSSYSHLGSVIVSEGDTVRKGQQIGLSGQSGAASTPHVHFQIDNDQAPWHPYWPYTYQEANAAGLTWSEAINAGLGKEKALATTIHPIMYIQKYLQLTDMPASSNPATSTNSPITATNSTSSATLQPNTPVVVSNAGQNPVVAQQITAPPLLSTPPTIQPNVPPGLQITGFSFMTDEMFFPGVPLNITIQGLDQQRKPFKDYKPKNGLSLSVILGGATLQKNFFFPEDFADGKVTTTATPTAEFGLRLRATDGAFTSDSAIIPMTLFKDVAIKSDVYQALNFLKNYAVIEGYPDGSFKPQNPVSRVEALKFILKGANKTLLEIGRLPFKDTDVNEWYANYVGTAYKNSVVNGYPDNSFRPVQTVNRAEFLKMLLLAADIKPETTLNEDVFTDVAKDAWYAPYVKFAKDKNLMNAVNGVFQPKEAMMRAEIAETIYRMIVIKLTGQSRYSTDLIVSASRAAEYFAAHSG